MTGEFRNAGSIGGFRPVKTPVPLRQDADIVEWFRRHHPKYQTAINAALRQYIPSAR